MDTIFILKLDAARNFDCYKIGPWHRTEKNEIGLLPIMVQYPKTQYMDRLGKLKIPMNLIFAETKRNLIFKSLNLNVVQYDNSDHNLQS